MKISNLAFAAIVASTVKAQSVHILKCVVLDLNCETSTGAPTITNRLYHECDPHSIGPWEWLSGEDSIAARGDSGPPVDCVKNGCHSGNYHYCSRVCLKASNDGTRCERYSGNWSQLPPP